MQQLDEAYWSARYRSDTAGWDIGTVSKPLKEYIDQLKDKSVAILIPGCGNAYEAEYLMRNGFSDVTILDFSEAVVENTRKLLQSYTGHGLKITQQDFFSHKGHYDLILEQTFFCAIDPSLRMDYLLHMYELLKPQGILAGVLFSRSFEEGPPFGGNIYEYRELFSQKFKIRTLDPCFNSIPPRKNNEVFINFQKINDQIV